MPVNNATGAYSLPDNWFQDIAGAINGVATQIQTGSPSWGGVAGGSADALTITVVPAGFTGYTAGQTFRFLTGASANSGPATLAVDGLPAKAVTRHDGSALAAGDLPASSLVTVVYDGTAFRLLGWTLGAALRNIDGLTGTGLVERTADGAAVVTVTTAGKALLDDTDAAAQRVTLGLGTAATADATSLRDRGTHTGTQAANTITGLHTVATSGSYSDLSGRPTLGTAADKNAGTGAGQVLLLTEAGKLPPLDGSQLTGLPTGSSSGSALSMDYLAFYLRANSLQSYSNSDAQQWRNLVTSPADGASASAYNFYLGGSASGESSDPTFYGAPGALDATNYFGFDGGDYLSLAGANTAKLNNLHKAGCDFSLWMLAYVVSSGSFRGLWSTASSFANSNSVRLARYEGAGGYTDLVFHIFRESNNISFELPVASPITEGLHFIGVSVRDGGQAFIHIDGAPVALASGGTTKACSLSSPSTADAAHVLNIGTQGGGMPCVEAGTRVYAVGMHTRALSAAEYQAVETQVRADCGNPA